MKKQKYSWGRPILSILLIITLAVTPLSASYKEVKAEEETPDIAVSNEQKPVEDATEPADNETAETKTPASDNAVLAASNEEETTWPILVNNNNSLIPPNGGFPAVPVIAYDEAVTFSLEGYTGTISQSAFLYLEADKEITEGIPWNIWQDASSIVPGDYYLGYSFEKDSRSYADLTGKYGVRIVKATLNTPKTLRWTTGSTANWDLVTTTQQGSALRGTPILGYEVALYKDSVLVETVQTADAAAASYDFTDRMKAQGHGVYTFQVKALVSESGKACYEASALSQLCSAASVVQVTVKGDHGITSVTPEAPFLLIPGNTQYNTKAINATLKNDDFTFDKWFCESPAITFTPDASGISATLQAADVYSGVSAIEVVAKTKDTKAPTITKYQVGTLTDGKTLGLTGKATDAQTGIAAYAFSTATTAGEVAQWELSENLLPGADAALEHKIAAPGKYYLYVKDGFGNVTKSGSFIQVTQVDYKNYFNKGSAEELTEYLLGEETLTLKTPVRPGYLFEGWYPSEQFEGKAIKYLNKDSHSDSPVTIYGKWDREKIVFSEEPKNIDITYDGKEHSLKAEVTNTAGDITYQWYKDSQLISDAVESTYKVKNVADAGKYYVEVTIALDGKEIKAPSTEATVAIAPKALTVKADDKEIGYTEPAPEYTLEYTGFAEGDTAGNIDMTSGTISCTYVKGMDAQNYDIAPIGFSAPNYHITHTNGTLKVTPNQVENDEAKVTAELEYSTMGYTGSEIKPAITVKRDGTLLSLKTDYEITYADNVNVGKAKASIIFQGNYSGTLVREFTITKSRFQPKILLNGWTYGDTVGTPKLDRNDSGGKVTYHYAKSGETNFTAVQPVAAGTYDAYAVVAATDNYEEIKTDNITFTIAKRSITLTAPDGTWSYDGNSHSDTKYTMTGSFAGSDSFQSVTVTGQITNVGFVDNVITYKLSSSTNANNYNITGENGKLTVTAMPLAVPVNHKWQSGAPGVANWVAVTRKDLAVQYELKLYRVGKDGGKVFLVETTSTENTEYSFAASMKRDSEVLGEASGYYYTVRAIPYSGVNKDNYLNSDTSTKSNNIYTVKVNVATDSGVSKAQIGGKTEVILLQGESVAILAETKAGYEFPEVVWSTESTALLSFSDVSKSETILRVSGQMDKPASAGITAHAEDEKPVIESFEAKADDTYNSVTFTLSARDSRELTGWMISTSEDAPDASDPGWQAVSGTSSTVTKEVSQAGSYYAYVKDNGDNVVRSKAPIAIYEIKFAAGSEGVTGSMQRLLKVQNTTITLPANNFVKEGYGFKNWSGTSGIYANNGTYAANTGDTLKAQWSNEQLNYNVAYYYMDITGAYSDASSYTSTFTGAYGAKISVTNATIQDNRIGMSIDTGDGKDTSITLDQPGQTLKVYYKRNSYTITYTYRIPGADTDTQEKQSFLYGATVSEFAKPAQTGYEFVGWLYGEAGKKPDSMPNKDIIATGSFAPVNTTYVVNYFEENLPTPDKTYTQNQTLTEKRNASHAEEIAFPITKTKQIEGFTVKGVTITYGNPGSSQPGDADIGTEKSGVVSAIAGRQLQVNYYYSRNSYDLTLNVWKGNRDILDNSLYTHTWTLLYGETINPADYEEYDHENWIKNPDDIAGYELASYADWSTGQKPTMMPAGSVTVTRDYISKTAAYYKLEIYYEGDVEDSYEQAESLYYYSNEGRKITVGDSDSYTINYNNFKDSVSGFAHYDFNGDHADNIIEGTVSATGNGQNSLVLKLYFKRKLTETEIRYYYNDGTALTLELIGTSVKSGKWGSTYDCEPLALFSGGGAPVTGYTSANTMVGEIKAEEYDFKTNRYVVSYAGRYWTDGKFKWPGHKYTKEEELGRESTVTFGNGVKTIIDGKEADYTDYINVYYTKVNPKDTYYLNVGYNPKGLKEANDTSFYQMTETIDGTEYKIRVANRADVFNDTFEAGTASVGYPGAVAYSGTYIKGALKGEYEEVKIGETTYYKKTEGSEHYLYLIDEKNQFFKGNRTSYDFLADTNKAKVGMAGLEAYLKNYKDTHSDPSKPNYDDKVIGALYENNKFSSIIYNPKTKSSDYVFTFDYSETYKVTFNLSGTTCANHVFTHNQEVTPQCEHTLFEKKKGYSIVWYKDSYFQEKAEPFNIKENTTLYGRYERNTLDFHEYIYYELADTISVEGKDVSYITADNLAAVKESLKESLASKETEGEEITFIDGAGTASKQKVKVTTYTYKGETVMIDRAYPCLTFQEVSMTSTYESYGKPGYHYDNTNSSNRLFGYCPEEAVPLSVYYARDKYAVTIIPNNAKVSNSQTTEYRFGQTVSIPRPTKNGYEFATWNWEECKETNADGSEQWESWPEAPAPDGEKQVTFAMPSLKLRAEAQWTPGTFEQTITHYFQDETQTYKTEWLKKLKDISDGGSAIQVQFNGTTLSEGKAYYEGAVLCGVSGTLANGKKAWFSDAVINGALAVADVSDLIAVEEPVSVTSKETTAVSTHVSSDFTMFSHSFTIYQEDVTVSTLRQGDIFTNTYGMQVDYYYTRAANFTVRTAAKALDGGAPGTPVGGVINSFYGQNIPLKLNLSEGYELVGWYKAADVLEGYAPDKDLTSLPLISDITGKTPISKEKDISIRVTENSAYVAVTKAKAVTLPTVTVTGKDSYTYGYASTPENALMAEVTLTGADAAATHVNSYQWYEGDTPIAGATSSTYLFPIGKEAKTYQYRCHITVGRKDNGRTAIVITNPYSITVGPAAMKVEATGYSGIYDGKSHGIQVNVKTPEDAAAYKVYYSETPLTKENYIEKGQAEPLTYKDVAVDTDGKLTNRTVHYYVDNPAGNYHGASGSAAVKISPITLTAKAGLPYTKVYDKQTKIAGNVTESGTGKYALAHNGHYTVNGLLPEDQGSKYLLDFDAAFNSAHVLEASYITLSNMVVVDNAQQRNYNYAFTAGSELIISGYISPFTLDVEWQNTNKIIYDGQEHAPTIKLKDGQTPPDSIKIAVLGGQKNVGTYTAYAAVKDSSDYQPGDYSFTTGTCGFTIAARPITITPDLKESIYNADTQTITAFTVNGLVAGQTYTAGTDKGGKDAASYTVTANNMVIQADGKTVTDNYAITYGSTTLTIKPKPVKVSNITAKDKVYDGRADATLELGAIQFDGLLPGEQLALDPVKISGSFDTAAAGEAKPVTLTVQAGVLTGQDARNYELNWADSQQGARAAISPAAITVKVENATTVYGEEAPFAVTYTGFKGSDTADVITGTPTYTVKKSDAQAYKTYQKTDGVGTYDINVQKDSLSADNYVFVVDTGKATLSVTPRPVKVGAVVGRSLSKVYDGTDNVKELVKAADYEFRKVNDDAPSGIVNGDTLTLKDESTKSFTAVYNSKDVKDASSITVANLDLNNPNYELSNDSFIIPGAITAKGLRVVADNKKITYGANAPAYTVSYPTGGFVQGEDEGVLEGVLVSACDYNVNTVDTRKAKGYTITPSGYTSDNESNYNIAYEIGTLTVDKAVISVTADNKTIVYKTELLPTAYTGKFIGFKYDDTEAVITNHENVTYACAADADSVAGTYPINVTLPGNLAADNYSFKAVPGTLTIEKKEITISGITLSPKVYDGTVALKQEQMTGTIAYDGIDAADESEKGFILETGKYDSKDVDSNINVSFTVKLNQYLEKRYLLSGISQTSASGAITQKDLTIKAESKTIPYGSPIPSYTVGYDGFVTGEEKGNLSGTLAFECDYVQNSDVASYQIMPRGYTSNNYKITFVENTLTVAKAEFAAPVPIWDPDNPGTVTWKAIPKIGNVEVANYLVELYKDGAASPVYTTTVAASLVSCNLLETIRGEGAGKYTVKVKVKAIASNIGNEANKNVLDSVAGTSPPIYAAAVSVAFADDVITAAGKDTIKINSASDSYIVVAGEKAIPITATFKNATGYKVKEWTGATSSVTISDGAQTGLQYAAKATWDKQLTSAAPKTLILSLAATSATLNATVVASPAEASYGYTAAEAPQLTATASAENTDNISGTDYTYTYQWKIIEKQGTGWKNIAGATERTLSFPLNYKAYNNYLVTCDITATRTDNQQSKLVTPASVKIVIKPAAFQSEIQITGWTYGDERKTPSVTFNPENKAVAYSYNTSKEATTGWTETMPTDAGTYYVKATIAAGENYGERSINPKEFIIAQARLDAPTELKMTASTTAPYGKATWKAVEGPKENAGKTETASAVNVSYQVKLYRSENTSGSGRQLVETYEPTKSCEYDMTRDITNTGIYDFTVTAIATSTNGKANCRDSAESTASAVLDVSGSISTPDNKYSKTYDGQSIQLSVNYTAEGEKTYQWYCNDTLIPGATQKIYDVTYVEQNGVYSCNITSGGKTYSSTHQRVTINPRPITIASASDQKPYDGTALKKDKWDYPADSMQVVAEERITCVLDKSITDKGTTFNTISSVTIEKGEGPAHKVLYKDGGVNNNYTVTRQTGTLQITAKSLNGAEEGSLGEGITATAPVDKTYDGTEQKQAITITYKRLGDTGQNLTAGTDYTVSYKDNIHAGTAKITIQGAGNYDGTLTQTFKINQRSVTLRSKNLTKPYDGKALKGAGISNLVVVPEKGSLAAGDTLAGVTFTGTQTDAGESDNTYKDVVIKNAQNAAVTGDYLVVPEYGTLTVTKISDTITINRNQTKIYDGTAVSDPTDGDITRAGTGAVTYTYYTKATGGIYTPLREAPKEAGTYYIKAVAAEDVNYLSSASDYQLFKIEKRKVTLTADNKSSIYGETLKELTYTAKMTDAALSEAAIVDGDNLNITLSCPVDASSDVGTYDILITAANPNYDITVNKGTYTITINAVSADVAGYEGTYDGNLHNITVTPVPDDATVYYGTVELTKDNYMTAGTTTNPSYQNAGSYPVYYYIHKDNYTALKGMESVEISKAEQVITAADIEVTYDGISHSVMAVTSGDGAISYTNNNKSKVGTYEVGIEVSETHNYKKASTKAALKISPKSIGQGISLADGIKITAPGDKTYDGKQQKQAIIVTDERIGDTGLNLIEDTDYSVTYKDNIHAGTAKITIQGKDNYEGTLTQEFKINQRPVTLRSKDLTKPYDGKALKGMGTGDLEVVAQQGSLADGDTLDGVTFTQSQTDAGQSTNTYQDVIIKNAQKAVVTGDYLVLPEYGTLTVTKISDTITINRNQTKTYDGTVVSNLTDSDIARAGTGAVTYTYYTKDAAEIYTPLTAIPKKAGTYYVKAVAAEDINYLSAESAYKQFKIEKRKVTLTADNKRSIYGEALKELTYTVKMSDAALSEAAIVDGDDLNITLISSVNASSDVGTYDIIITAANADYDITANKGTYTITINAVSADVAGFEGTYDGNPHSITVTPVPDDATVYYGTVELTKDNYMTAGTTTNPSYQNAGSYPVYYYIHKDNYTALKGMESVEISKAEQVITAADIEVTYDGISHSVMAVTSGDGAISYTNNNKSKAGTYTVGIEAGKTENYNAAAATAALVIKKRPITIQSESASKVYDGTNLENINYAIPTGTLADGDTIESILVKGSRTDAGKSENSISNAVITAATAGEDRTKSYQITYIAGTLEVKKAPQEPPQNLIPANETIEGKSDGNIRGIKGGMEYRRKGDSNYIAVTKAMIEAGAIQNITTGAYEIRYAENKNFYASDTVVLEIKYDAARPDTPPEQPQNPGSGNNIIPNVTPTVISPGVREQIPTSEVPEDRGNKASAINKNTGNPSGVTLEDKKITKTEVLPYGTGNIKVVIHSNEDNAKRVNAALVSSQQVIDATLSNKEKLAIANGDSIEIRLTIQVIEEEVTKEDAALIGDQIEQLVREIDGLTFGQYLDITLDKRLNQGDWECISEAGDDIGIEIDIPRQLQFEQANYFVSRVHKGETHLLYDTDKESKTITISSKYFSTYALLYTMEKVNSCIWHIVILITLAIYLLAVLTWKEERHKRYRVLFAGTVVIFIIAAIAGTCLLDWPIAVGSTVLAVIAIPIKKRLSSRNN